MIFSYFACLMQKQHCYMWSVTCMEIKVAAILKGTRGENDPVPTLHMVIHSDT